MESILQNIIEERIAKRRQSSQSVFAGEAEEMARELLKRMDISKEFLDILKVTAVLGKTPLEKKFNVDEVRRKVELKMNLNFEKINTMTDAKLDNIIILALAYINVGLFYIKDEKLKTLDAEIHFQKCLKLLEGKELDPKIILIITAVLNKLGGLWIQLKQLEESYPFFNKALELYMRYTKEADEYPDPINIFNLNNVILNTKLTGELNTKILLDSLHLITLKHLTDLYEYKWQDKHKFVMYVHNLLKKNIPITTCSRENFANWICSVVVLSRYFISNHRFTDARNLIAAARYMYYIFKKNIFQKINEKNPSELDNDTNESPTISDQAYNTLNIVRGYIADHLVMYEFMLLHVSSLRLPKDKDGQPCKVDESESKVYGKSAEKLNTFARITLRKHKKFITQSTNKCVSNFNKAKIIVGNILKNLRKKFESSIRTNTSCNDYVTIIINISKAYKYLGNFAEDLNILILVHKTRIQILENVLEKIHRMDTLEEIKSHNDDCFCFLVHHELLMARSDFNDVQTEICALDLEQSNYQN